MYNGELRIFNGKAWETIGQQEDVKVKAKNIVGQINMNQIASVPGSRIDGIPAEKIAGVLGSGVKVSAGLITGSFYGSNIRMDGACVVGSLTNAYISGSLVHGSIVGSQVIDIPAKNIIEVSGLSIGSLASGLKIIVSNGSSLQTTTLYDLQKYINP